MHSKVYYNICFFLLFSYLNRLIIVNIYIPIGLKQMNIEQVYDVNT